MVPGMAKNPFSIEGKTAIVTGGGVGIGKSIAIEFARAGADVAVCSRKLENCEAVAKAIRDLGRRSFAMAVDVRQEDQVKAIVDRAVAEFGRLDVMVNNAGLAEAAPLDEISLQSWNRVIAVTLTSVFLGMKYCLPIMRAQGRGVIVNTASVSGTAGDYGLSSYNAAKAGVINLTRSAALENARDHIRINCVCPGAIDTRGIQILGRERADELRRQHAAVHPIGRVGEADEIANTALFLASDEASFITGAAIVVDGGLTAHTGLPHFPRPTP